MNTTTYYLTFCYSVYVHVSHAYLSFFLMSHYPSNRCTDLLSLVNIIHKKKSYNRRIEAAIGYM